MTEQPRVSALRGLTVLAAIAGVLAMHGFTAGHHGAAARSASHLPAVSAPFELASDSVPAAAAHGLQLLVKDAHGCAGCQDAPGVFLLCVAALLAAGVGVLGLTLGRSVLVVPGARPPSAMEPRALAPPRCPDIVKELCISRT